MKKAFYFIAILGTVFAISRVVAEPYHLSGDCMEPGFKDGDLYFLNHLAPYVRDYKIGDVVLYKHEDRVWISRVVAKGGEFIRIEEGKILVNG